MNALQALPQMFAAMVDNPDVKRATKYLGDNYTAKLTRAGKYDRRDRSMTFVLTIGRPNYAERQFVKKCRTAGEPLPVKKVQLKFQPRRKRRAV